MAHKKKPHVKEKHSRFKDEMSKIEKPHKSKEMREKKHSRGK